MITIAEGGEVAQAKESILAEQDRLKSAYIAATNALRARVAERESAERNLSGHYRAMNAANEYLKALTAEGETALISAVLKIAEGAADSGNVDLRPLDEVQRLLARGEAVRIFLREMGPILAESEDLVKFADVQLLDAEADQIDALVAEREFQLKLTLAPVIAAEGEIKVTGVGVTSALRRQSSETRLRAAGLRDEITKSQKRKNHVGNLQ